MQIKLADLDRIHLVGDEDCGVALDCLDCDRRGLPIAYYTGIARYYVDDDAVVQAPTIEALLVAARDHRTRVHP